jgi:mannose-6-phosphate isomerase
MLTQMTAPGRTWTLKQSPDAMNVPFRFTPFLRAMVWGGRRLASVLGRSLPTTETYGESWEISDHASHRSVIAAGSKVGQTLRDLMANDSVALLGAASDKHKVFPWLVKYLDAADWLSVQVHPDDESVQHLWPGEGGKTEAWFVLAAEKGSRIYAGLLPGVDEQCLRAAAQDGTVADCLHSFTPQSGDCIFLPAGTVHAVGGGVVMAEIQQTSDATFRLFDWNRRDAQGRSRTLHLEQALACIDWRRGPVQPIRVPEFAGADATTTACMSERRSLVRCPYFHLDYIQSHEPFRCGRAGRMQVMVVLRGKGRFDADAGEEPLSPGQVWLLPATLSSRSCRPESSLAALVCTLPD